MKVKIKADIYSFAFRYLCASRMNVVMFASILICSQFFVIGEIVREKGWEGVTFPGGMGTR